MVPLVRLEGVERKRELPELPTVSERKAKRVCTTTLSNFTISRGAGLYEEKSCALDLLQRHPEARDHVDRIQDHAHRRVLIFYYIALCYYQSNLQVEQIPTSHQHGKASCGFCHAAHSSILPNLSDNFSKLPKVVQEKMCEIYPIAKEEGRLISVASQIYRLMNSTVEVASEVNEFDMLIEGSLRKEALHLINQVSKGYLTPYNATKIFVSKLKDFFVQSKQQFLEKRAKLENFLTCEKTLHLFLKQIDLDQNEELILALKEVMKLVGAKKKIEQFYRLSTQIKLHDRLFPIQPLIDKVYSYYFTLKKEIEEAPDKRALLDILDSLEKNSYLSSDTEASLVALRMEDNLAKIKQKIKKILYNSSLIDLFSRSPCTLKEFREIFQKIKMPKTPYPSKYLFEALERGKLILELQEKHTLLPRQELLSGKWEGDFLIPLSDEELLQQRRELLSF